MEYQVVTHIHVPSPECLMVARIYGFKSPFTFSSYYMWMGFQILQVNKRSQGSPAELTPLPWINIRNASVSQKAFQEKNSILPQTGSTDLLICSQFASMSHKEMLSTWG